jgi:hypothetical protein
LSRHSAKNEVPNTDLTRSSFRYMHSVAFLGCRTKRFGRNSLPICRRKPCRQGQELSESPTSKCRPGRRRRLGLRGFRSRWGRC